MALYRRRQAAVYRFALHMSGSSAIAEEVTQEVFLTVIRDGKRFDESRGTAVSYLLGVARNHVLKLLRTQSCLYRASRTRRPKSRRLTDDVCWSLTRAETIENDQASGAGTSRGLSGSDRIVRSAKRSAMQKRLRRWVFRSEPFDRVLRGAGHCLPRNCPGQVHEGFNSLRCFA